MTWYRREYNDVKGKAFVRLWTNSELQGVYIEFTGKNVLCNDEI